MSNTREKKFFVPHLATSHNNINKRWFVYWYEPVEGTDARKRRKCYGKINYAKTVGERLNKANELIKQLYEQNFFYQTRVEKNQSLKETLLHKIVSDKHLRLRSFQSYITIVNNFIKWFNNYPERCSHLDAQNFINYLHQKQTSHTTINHYRNTLKSLYNELLKRKEISTNPFDGFKKLREYRESKKHFNQAEISAIKEYLQQHNENLWLTCQFVFYTFIRPGELRFLQVKHIDFINLSITIPGIISKNGKTQTVAVPKPFYNDILKLKDLPKETYVVGLGMAPVNKAYLSDKMRTALDILGFDKCHTLYSFKHTGAMMFIKKTKDVKALQLQLRHHSLDMVNEYLKNMGALDNEEIRENFPAI